MAKFDPDDPSIPIIPYVSTPVYLFKWRGPCALDVLNDSTYYYCRERHRLAVRVLKATAKALGFTFVGIKWEGESRTNKKDK